MDSVQFQFFCDKVVKEIAAYLPDVSLEQIYIRRANKNNGIKLTALHMLKEGQHCSPAIYLESYYQRFLQGESLDELLLEMAQYYRDNSNALLIEEACVLDYACIRSKIIMRLVSYDLNREELAGCPHRMWQDLAVTYRWLVQETEIGISTALVTRELMDEWQINEESLYQAALCNMPKAYPVQCITMSELLLSYARDYEEREMMRSDLEYLRKDKEAVQMFVLTNSIRINGATSVLYPHTLDFFAAQQGCGFYLIPSSVHEMILIPKAQDISAAALQQMLLEANYSVVSRDDFLSNHIYYYDDKKRDIQIVA